MSSRNTSILKPMLAVLAMTILVVAMACRSEDATPTSEPDATETMPTATSSSVDGAPTDTPVGDVVTELGWMERYLKSPGYNPDWGEPKTGGTFVFGANRDGKPTPVTTMGGCYTHGCWDMPFNALFRIDVWQGRLDAIEGDLVESWEMSEDLMTLTMQLREGVMFFDKSSMPTESTVPDEFNGGKILGDEFVCEDAKATVERNVWPKEWETRITRSPAAFNHLESAACTDGPRGYTLVMSFNAPLAKTMSAMSSGGYFPMLDKDYIEWIDAFGEAEDRAFLDTEIPDNFLALHGTGAFVPVDIELSISSTYRANPTYWRDGLPLLGEFRNVVIKDNGTRFTALVSGKIHFFGEGSYSFTSGQVEQAMRDFPDLIEINAQTNMWARGLEFNPTRPPFDDVRVRKAVHLALDRAEWADFRRVRVGDTVLEGTNLAHLMPPGTIWATPKEELSTWPGLRQPKDQDIAEANRLLDEVFGEGNRPVGLGCVAAASIQSNVDACLFVLDQLKKHLNWIVTTDFAESAVVSERRNGGGFDLYVNSSPSTVIGDPDDQYLRLAGFGLAKDKVEHDGLWAEMPGVMTEVESMALAQSAELDPQKRLKVVRELERKFADEVHWRATLGWTNIFPSWRTELRGFKGYNFYSSTKWAIWERVWLAQ